MTTFSSSSFPWLARDTNGSTRRRAGGRPASRKGLSTMWVVVSLSTLLVLMCFVLNIANLWLARVELENAMEAAALAAVKEWGDAGGGSTLVPREVGVAYAYENAIRCQRVEIATNYDPNAGPDNPNENLTCEVGKADPENGIPPTGNLIFGAILFDDPLFPVTFNAGVRPGCGPGQVLFDATDQGNLAADNAWGVAFRKTEDTPPGLKIEQIIINLQAVAEGEFDFSSEGPTLSDNVSPHKVHDNSGNEQPDIFGFTNPEEQIKFTPDTGFSPTLTIDFHPDGTDDGGFEPGDRFRFGARVRNVSQGSGSDDGDGIGRDEVEVTVIFSLGGALLAPVSATFFDNQEQMKDCLDPAKIEPLTGSLIVHPTEIPDLPCPAASAPKNNGQSYVELAGGGAGPFAVRARAKVQVPIFCGPLRGLDFTSYCVSAKATAVYDCASRRPRLIKVDRFICPGP